MTTFSYKIQLKNHLSELKSRFIYVMLSSVCTFAVAYHKSIQLTYLFLLSFSINKNNNSLKALLPDGDTLVENDPPEFFLKAGEYLHLQKNFIFTDVYEAFSSALSICLMSTISCVLPFLVYQLVCFFMPSWRTHEKKSRCKHIVITFLCWFFYLYLIHSFVIPKLCTFFLQFQIEKACLSVTIEPKIVSYVSWTYNLLGCASLIFVLACALYGCVITGYINLRSWSVHRKSFFFISVLCAGFISPPELWTQCVLSTALFLICEFFIWISFVKRYHNSIT